VADIDRECHRLDAASVTFLRAPEREPWGGVIATMVDPDGSYVQLVQFTPS